MDAVIHMAAETHVDNSLGEGAHFVNTNVNGTLHLLDMVRAKAQHGMPHFIHISTDEVYGSITDGAATTDSPLNPSSPYAASKAAADMLVQAWGKTYGVPYAIIRPTNCYGPDQYPEKLIPKTVRSVMLGRDMPIHGNGQQTRCWLNVEDLADAILLVLDKKLTGVYNVGGNAEVSVGDVVVRILAQLNPTTKGGGFQTGFQRPACDTRYAVDDSAIRKEGWTPSGKFWADLPAIVELEKQAFRW